MQDLQSTEKREVVEETINAYRVQKLSDGSVRIRSGGHVVGGSTYYDALQRYAQSEQEQLEDLPRHLYVDHKERISDGVIPLYSFDSTGFTPREILNEVTGQPMEIVLELLDDERSK